MWWYAFYFYVCFVCSVFCIPSACGEATGLCPVTLSEALTIPCCCVDCSIGKFWSLMNVCDMRRAELGVESGLGRCYLGFAKKAPN